MDNVLEMQELLDAASEHVGMGHYREACMTLDVYDKRRKAGESEPSGGHNLFWSLHDRMYFASQW